MSLRDLSDQELLGAVVKVVASHKALTARLVVLLGEIEERSLHLRAGFSSMFEYCVKELRLSEGEAFRRILAARLGRRFPVVEIEALLARRFPQPDVPSRIRRLSDRIQPLSEARFKVEFTASAVLREKLERCRDLISHANPSRELGVVIERAVDLLLGELEARHCGKLKRAKRQSAEVGQATQTRRERLRIANATRREVYERDGMQCTYFSADGRRCEAKAFLELDHVEARALGGGDEAENLRVRCRAHNQLWAEETFGREAVDRGRQARSRKEGGRGNDAPRRMRHSQVEGQASTMAELDPYFCQRKWNTGESETNGEPETSVSRANTANIGSCQILEKVRMALVNLGFANALARRAIAETMRTSGAPAPLTFETALREALQAATRMAMAA